MEIQRKSSQEQRVKFQCVYDNMLLHIPHSSTSFPEDSCHSFMDLNQEERLLIDYYTDELFVPSKETKCISSIVFPFCRLYCDVERLINDPLEKEGLGISYSRRVVAQHGKKVRSFGGKADSFMMYGNYHAEVSEIIKDLDGRRLLVDCHSFSNLRNLLNSNPPDIDVCIGYNDDETCPNKVVIGNIVRHFGTLGYKVGVNEPFSNSKTFSVPVKYHSVMIEVNKRLYMNEQTLDKTDDFDKIRNDILSLYDILLK